VTGSCEHVEIHGISEWSGYFLQSFAMKGTYYSMSFVHTFLGWI
jgi:hypothetical protein